tara:strand:+ start:10143 stop:11798 length:1656 start_codon:yes stop_codon:yes gene_type:complete
MSIAKHDQYLGNPNLKRAHTKSRFTKKQIEEVVNCLDSPEHFIEKYLKIVTLDKGLVPFEMYDFQRRMVNVFHKNRFSICKLPRQSGKSTIIVAYLLHYALFNDNVNIAILANKSSTARDLLGRLQLAYEHLPKWLQQGVLNWNKGSLELENGSKIIAASTSSSAVRGMTFNIIFLDEFAYVPNNIAEEFFSSVYPTISSGESSKVIIVSTPHGMNMYYKLWMDAVNKKNDYVPTEVHWSEVPGRDDAWKEQTIRNTSLSQFQTEFECEFLGSVDTLITASKIKTMAAVEPKRSNNIDVFEMPKPGHIYTMCIDVSRGLSNDYSALIVFDVTKAPYKMVCKFRDNDIKPIVFPNIIQKIGNYYNKAFCLIEINDLGQQVADALQFELEYDNMMMVTQRGRSGQILGGGFSGRGNQLGLRMTKAAKKIGCSNLKSLVEGDKLIIQDFDIISELSTFIAKGKSFEAESGATDDLVMCMVIFSWMANQRYFKELTNVDVRGQMFTEQQNAIEQDMAPFGFIDNGLDDPDGKNNSFFDDAGELWQPVEIRKGEHY